MVLGPNGEPVVHDEYYVAISEEPDAVEEGDVEGDLGGDIDGDDQADQASDDEDDGEDAAPETERYSQRLKDELAMMKTELLAVHVANNPHFALDLGTFVMVHEANRLGYSGIPSELRANAPTSRVPGFKSETPAAEAWAKLDESLNRTWLNHAEFQERYDAFCALDDDARAAWLGWAVARTLHAVPDGMTGSGFLDHLGAKLGIDVAAWWRPTARNFFNRVNKSVILTLFEKIGGTRAQESLYASRKFDLEASSEKLFAGQIIAEADVKERALAWLPGPMRFVPETDAAEPELLDAIPVAANDAADTGTAQPGEPEVALPEAA